ncbi:glycosyl transferase family 1 [Homoserinimonas aerilata]|uniref:Glycosyl transferase family 1 n=1 Tax=Homoserinimonas aerilata TaxID=1162970 RepID=A0A542YKM4_9MICO|nr:glycosyltransferase [Homoserinimonas aerilata]TQL48649.1 glycosyl transferase family 1 [Homoserinimonas aerilata]
MPQRRHVLVVTADSLSTRMAGPAIRAFEMAKQLSKVADVRLVSTTYAALEHPDFEIIDATAGGLVSSVNWSDVIVFQGHLLASFPWIKETDKIIVADIYDPMHLEQLEQGKDLGEKERLAGSIDVVGVLNDQIQRADYMLCASDKQRDFWLGQLAAMGRVNPVNYDHDPSLRKLLDVAPFGLDDTAPVQRRHAIKGAIPGIGMDDKVILWGGGIYNWFDPLTLVKAVAALAERHPNVRLFFLGGQHPNPAVPKMRMAFEAQQLAERLGLLNKIVFFNEGWVPYEERADFLLDADLGVSTHLDHLETAFSFRTRILDYLWASLPIVSTEGDTFAELIAAHRLGQVVPAENVAALERALEEVLFDEAGHAATRARVAEFAESMRWPIVLKPLVDFCLTGERAPDLIENVELTGMVKLRELRTRVEGLESSFSWRVTKPIRSLSDVVKKLRS